MTMTFSTSNLSQLSSSTQTGNSFQPTNSDKFRVNIFNEPVPELPVHDELWEKYVEKATSFDERIIEDWNKIVDVTLVFVGVLY